MTDLQKWYRDQQKEYSNDKDYRSGYLILSVTEDISELMEEGAVSRKQLAEKLGTSPAYITKILRGNNFTLKTLSDIAHELNAEVKVEFIPRANSRKQTKIIQSDKKVTG